MYCSKNPADRNECARNFNTSDGDYSLGIIELTEAINILIDNDIMNEDGFIDTERFPFISSYLGFIISNSLMMRKPNILPMLVNPQRNLKLNHNYNPIPFISTNLLNSLTNSEKKAFLDKMSESERIAIGQESEYALIFQENLNVVFSKQYFTVNGSHLAIHKIERIAIGEEPEIINQKRIRAYLYLLYSFARGLKSIHDLGLIHNDIKPDNIAGSLEKDAHSEYERLN